MIETDQSILAKFEKVCKLSSKENVVALTNEMTVYIFKENLGN